MTAPMCAGRSSRGGVLHDCPAAVAFEVSRPAGREPDGTPRYSVRHACGRHLSWLVTYVTTKGGSVRVTRL